MADLLEYGCRMDRDGTTNTEAPRGSSGETTERSRPRTKLADCKADGSDFESLEPMEVPDNEQRSAIG